MGFLDKLKGSVKSRATEMVDKHGDQIAGGLDKAAGVVDKKTKGKYTDKLASSKEKAKDALDKLDDKNDDIK
jgi:uncharacterized protein YjbJ (UPF0337 family)